MPETIRPGDADTLPERVAAVVAANTTEQQPDAVREATIVRILGRQRRKDRGGWETVVSPGDVRAAIATAVEDELVEAIDDGGDGARYRLPTA